MTRSRPVRLFAAGVSFSLVLAACGGGDDDAATDTTGAGAAPLAAVTLNGSGATFPKAFYDAAIDGFKERQPTVTVNYGGGGSGKGRTELQGGLSDPQPPVTITSSRAAPPAGKSRPAGRGSRRADDRFRYVTAAAGLLVVAILALVVWSTTKEALPAFREEGLGFLTSSRWNAGGPPRDPRRHLPPRVRRIRPVASMVRFLSNVMAGVPSIVMGLFIFTIYVLHSDDGFSGRAGGLALACLMLPIVIRTTEAMLQLVPNELRDAAYALGQAARDEHGWEQGSGPQLPPSKEEAAKAARRHAMSHSDAPTYAERYDRSASNWTSAGGAHVNAQDGELIVRVD